MQAFDLTGKVAIVTGGNSGIGLAMARGLTTAGATVALAARNVERSETAAEELNSAGGNAFAIGCDVTDEQAIRDMIDNVEKRCKRLDILVNNAGTSVRKLPQDLSFDDWRHVQQTNIDSAFLCCNAAHAALVRAGGGKVLNNGSMLSIFGSPWGAAYGASKGAMVQFTKSLATAWAPDNIQVNCFMPGWIDTPLTVGARDQVPGLEDKVTARTPAGRWGDPSDFEGIAVFLSSAASDFITGTAIPVDGGFSVSIV